MKVISRVTFKEVGKKTDYRQAGEERLFYRQVEVFTPPSTMALGENGLKGKNSLSSVYSKYGEFRASGKL